jgi:hypothetical protein
MNEVILTSILVYKTSVNSQLLQFSVSDLFSDIKETIFLMSIWGI